MKRILALTIALVISHGAIALAKEKPITYKADTWRSVQVIDVVTLSKSMQEHVRQIIGVKCNFRGKDIRHMKPNWYQSSLWQPIPGQSGKFAYVPVMVAKADLEAFKSIPTETSGAEITLYGHVEYDIGPNYRFVRLIGRNVHADSAGNATVTW